MLFIYVLILLSQLKPCRCVECDNITISEVVERLACEKNEGKEPTQVVLDILRIPSGYRLEIICDENVTQSDLTENFNDVSFKDISELNVNKCSFQEISGENPTEFENECSVEEHIKRDFLGLLPNLELINLNGIHDLQIQRGTFDNIQSLKVFMISTSKISAFPADRLDNVSLPPGLCQSLPKLEELIFQNTDIKTLPQYSFQVNSNKQYLPQKVFPNTTKENILNINTI